MERYGMSGTDAEGLGDDSALLIRLTLFTCSELYTILHFPAGPLSSVQIPLKLRWVLSATFSEHPALNLLTLLCSLSAMFITEFSGSAEDEKDEK